MALAASVSAAPYQANGVGAETTRRGHLLLMTSTVLIRCIRLLPGFESRLKSRERRLRRVGHLEAIYLSLPSTRYPSARCRRVRTCNDSKALGLAQTLSSQPPVNPARFS